MGDPFNPFLYGGGGTRGGGFVRQIGIHFLQRQATNTPPKASNDHVEGSGTAPAKIGVFGLIS
jgi:hypothetical protein